MLNIFKNLVNNVVLPLAGRAGTSVATVLVGYGIQAEPAQQIGLGVGALIAVDLDLLSDWIGRRAVADKTFRQAVGIMVDGSSNG